MAAIRWIVLGLALTGNVLADTIRVRADVWYPVNGDPAAVRPGFGIEALRLIWGEAGHQIDYQLMSWGRSLSAVRSGAADCVIGAYKQDAPDLRFPAQMLGQDGVGVYVRAPDDWRYTGTESLAGRTVGAIADYSYGKSLDDWLADATNADRIEIAYGVDALEGNIRKLLAGRVDVLFESPMVMASSLGTLDLEPFVRLAGEGKPETPFYIACSATSSEVPQWLEQFDGGMQSLRESGQWRRLLADYGLSED
ncbi:MAG: transporter substrate-binding domain-containing protein [Alcanivoracaceae bacterium]|nr:transporter substrate-binding domain-containing protein [Alcanivoracaceae bacterium]